MSTNKLSHLKDGDKIYLELRQCLSQSGTTWQGGECVIILNSATLKLI